MAAVADCSNWITTKNKGQAMKAGELGGTAATVLALVFAMSFTEPAGSQTPDASKAPAKSSTGKAKKKPTLDRKGAENQYQQARAMEGKGDEKGAFKAYLAAGESGHGLAQKRLGEIYEKGNSATRRDYDTALRWYEKARAQGIEIPKPIVLKK